MLTIDIADQSPFDQDPYGEDEDDMSDEEDYDLEEVSSDVEINPDELDIPSDDEEYVPVLHIPVPSSNIHQSFCGDPRR